MSDVRTLNVGVSATDHKSPSHDDFLRPRSSSNDYVQATSL